MGFINWNGPKEDSYEELVEFAAENLRHEEAILEESARRQRIAENFLLPEVSKIDDVALLKTILGSQKQCSLWLDDLCAKAAIDLTEDVEEFQKDFWMSLIEGIVTKGKLDFAYQCKIIDTFLNKIFKLNYPISAVQHLSLKKGSDQYKNYFYKSFEAYNTKTTYWQWIGALGEKAKELSLSNNLVKLCSRLELYLAIYLNFILEDKDIGKNIPKRYSTKEKTMLSSLKSSVEMNEILSRMHNPRVEILEKKISLEGETKQIINKTLFEKYLSKETIDSEIMAIRLLLQCKMEDSLRIDLETIRDRIFLLRDSSEKYRNIYSVDTSQFTEYYIPEALRLIETYLEYLNLGIGKEILSSIEEEVVQATKTLIVGINGKIDELYRFVSMETKATAKAVDAMITRDGYVGADLKLNIGGNENE